MKQLSLKEIVKVKGGRIRRHEEDIIGVIEND